MSKGITVGIKFLPAVQENEVHSAVDRAIEIIDSWGLKYEVGPCNTTVEGDLQDILNKVGSMCKKIEKSVGRFAVFLDIDYCRDGISIDNKIEKYR
ncbi:MAG TPA: thiamine-binding protein [Victivallales bacterium]|nr:thiamine-binding protein [Victivallales bacterium]